MTRATGVLVYLLKESGWEVAAGGPACQLLPVALELSSGQKLPLHSLITPPLILFSLGSKIRQPVILNSDTWERVVCDYVCVCARAYGAFVVDPHPNEITIN